MPPTLKQACMYKNQMHDMMSTSQINLHIFMEQHFPLFPIFLTFLLFIFMVLRTRKNSKTNNFMNPNLPPGPWKLPLIGNIHQVAGPLIHRRFTDLAKKYGPVMQVLLGEVRFVVISSRETAKEVMKTNEDIFVDRPDGVIPRVVFYDGKAISFTPYGEYWKHLRKVCSSRLLSPQCVRSFRSTMEEEVSEFITLISSKEGSPINLSKMLSTLTFGLITRVIMGKKGKNQALLSSIEEWKQGGAGFDVADIFPSFKLFHSLGWARSKFMRQHQEIGEMLDAIINERRASKIRTKTGENEVEEDFLDVLVNMQHFANSEFTNDNIKAILLEFFLAGSDSSAAVLEWAMSEMLKNPRQVKRAQKEVRGVFAKTGNAHGTSLPELKYLQLIVKETTRLHPPAPLILRACREGCKINGHDIPGSSNVMINAWAIGRDPTYWDEAEKFNPERFQDSSVDYMGNNFEFIPFGAGKRKCPGMTFGLAIVELTLAKLLYHFDWELCDGVKNEDLDMTEDVALGSTVRRKHELNLIPISYHPNPSHAE